MVDHFLHLLDHLLEQGHENFSKKKLIIGIAVGFVVLVMGFMIFLITKAGWKKKLEKTGRLYQT